MSQQTLPATSAGSPGGGGGLPRRRRLGADMLFRGTATFAGSMVLIIIAAIAVFLVVKAIPAFQDDTENFFTFKEWFTDGDTPRFGIAATAFGTVLTAALALLIAVPVALGIALCLSHYAHRRVATTLSFIIDLLAAVPSVVFGLWGRDYFYEPVTNLSKWLHDTVGWLPIFGSEGPYGKSVLLGSIVLAIMILPIVTSLSREVFLQTPGRTRRPRSRSAPPSGR
ncbi:PstC family ABC transporter permease [Dactylosporangium cerinum]